MKWRNGSFVMSTHYSILHGCLAQVTDFLVVFGAAGDRARVLTVERGREREEGREGEREVSSNFCYQRWLQICLRQHNSPQLISCDPLL